jgi:hypothetical protein
MASYNPEVSKHVGPSTLHAFSPGYEPDFSRIAVIDVFKGVAVMAGLFVTILYWGGFSQAMQFSLTDFPGGIRYRSYAAISLLLEGKMMGLVSLAFGAGIILFFCEATPRLGPVKQRPIRTTKHVAYPVWIGQCFYFFMAAGYPVPPGSHGPATVSISPHEGQMVAGICIAGIGNQLREVLLELY